ncbi:MAG: hypothetical protein ACREAW_05850 [Nitrososphaera sp.]|jgi:hypothetical protein|nr:hypothetical protein [Nitrososphaera sp.]
MTKMLNVNIDTSGIDATEAKEWVNELANVYADMQISDVNVSGNKISFKAGFSGMDDTEPDDIKMKLEEYLTMNETFHAKSINVR